MKDYVKDDFLKARDCWDMATQKFISEHTIFERKAMVERYLEELFSLVENRPVWFFYNEGLDYVFVQWVQDFTKKYTDKSFFLNIPKRIEGKNMFVDGHPNELGHREIADVIYTTIVDKQAVCIAK